MAIGRAWPGGRGPADGSAGGSILASSFHPSLKVTAPANGVVYDDSGAVRAVAFAVLPVELAVLVPCLKGDNAGRGVAPDDRGAARRYQLRAG
jgi:hypothetical protein